MNLTFLLSILVSIFSLALVLVGIPAQITKNYREKRSGQPLLTIFIALGFYASQIGFFTATGAYLPLISFAVGIVMWGITLIQYFLYRKNSGPDPRA
ncbi:MAG: hypothetical protein WC817_01660 [Patescibacteria group bacterium]|jgi:uncharacterized membrane protein